VRPRESDSGAIVRGSEFPVNLFTLIALGLFHAMRLIRLHRKLKVSRSSRDTSQQSTFMQTIEGVIKCADVSAGSSLARGTALTLTQTEHGNGFKLEGEIEGWVTIQIVINGTWIGGLPSRIDSSLFEDYSPWG
jgi:hypothetical protein